MDLEVKCRCPVLSFTSTEYLQQSLHLLGLYKSSLQLINVPFFTE